MDAIRRKVLISGVVQGVCFRAYTRDAAKKAGLTGWVRNLPDGRVEAVFEGSAERVQSVVDWCRNGSPGSVVEKVHVVEEPHKGEFTDFSISFRGRL